MGLSSNTLWHQTLKESLKGIIRDQCLYYAYSVENVVSDKGRMQAEFAFPMISVCDLPLAETGGYLKKYGDYTIGFSSRWGRKKGFSTVWYCDYNSITLHNLLSLFARKIKEYGFDTSRDIDYQCIVYLLSYVKQYEGPLPKKNFRRYRFYDEREQRLVPSFEALNKVSELQFITDYDDYKKHHNNSPILSKNLNVSFGWDDVKYIIVEREAEKNEFRSLVEKCAKRTDLNISYFTNKEVKEDIIGLEHNIQEKEEFRPISNEEIDKIFEALKKV